MAGPGSRAAAYFIDFMILFLFCYIMVNLLANILILLLQNVVIESRELAAAIASLVFFAIYNGYFIVLEWLMNGQTPGKRLLHIRVIKQGGYALRFYDTLSRNLLRVIDFLPFFYGVGLVSLLLTRDSRRLGDLVAGTLVVYQEPEQVESIYADLPPADENDEPIPAIKTASIPDPLISLALEYLQIRDELSPRARQEIALELMNLIRRTSGLAPRSSRSVESFLASIIRSVVRNPSSTSQTPLEDSSESLS